MVNYRNTEEMHQPIHKHKALSLTFTHTHARARTVGVSQWPGEGGGESII